MYSMEFSSVSIWQLILKESHLDVREDFDINVDVNISVDCSCQSIKSAINLSTLTVAV